ncbi:hypothetical protein ACV0MU_08800 [Klebsiella pneumoniae subsp. ozaenae]
MSKPTIRKVTNAMKKLLTKLRVISAVSKAQTLTALTTAARITPMTDITELAKAAEKYRSTLEAHRNNPRDGVALNAWDDATSKFMELVDNDELNIISGLLEALEKAKGMEAYWKTQCRGITDHCEELQARIAGLEREQEQLRPVGVMSEKAFHRLENSESRFIALWPRPGIFLPRKRPEDGVIVYARTAAAAGIKVEAE